MYSIMSPCMQEGFPQPHMASNQPSWSGLACAVCSRMQNCCLALKRNDSRNRTSVMVTV
jgi:hypothetical protein